MGIPHLAHSLQPYGTKTVLPVVKALPDQDGDIAIVDGPSLAYHCFYLCLSARQGARNAFEATPSYKELGDVALRCLDQLQAHGLKVYASQII